MDEVLDRIIKQSGAMWETVRERWDTAPVLVKTSDGPFGNVYEVRLPRGERHPFWSVTERVISAGEAEDIHHELRYGNLHGIGHLHYPCFTDTTKGMRVRGYVYNGRHPHKWLDSTEQVRVTVERIEVE